MQHTLGCFSPKTDILHARVLSMLALCRLPVCSPGWRRERGGVLNSGGKMLSPQQGIERRALVTLSLQQCMCPRLATVAPASPGHRSAAHPELPSRPLCACQPSGMATSSSRAIPRVLPLVTGRPVEGTSSYRAPQGLGRQGWSSMPAAHPYPQIPSVESNENSTMPGPPMSAENWHCLPSKMSQRCRALRPGQVPRRAPYCGPDQLLPASALWAQGWAPGLWL